MELLVPIEIHSCTVWTYAENIWLIRTRHHIPNNLPEGNFFEDLPFIPVRVGDFDMICDHEPSDEEVISSLQTRPLITVADHFIVYRGYSLL